MNAPAANFDLIPKDFNSHAPWWLAGAAALGMMGSALWQLQVIPEELAAAAGTLLQSNGLERLQVVVDGRDLTLSGPIEPSLDRAALRTAVQALPGILSVRDALSVSGRANETISVPDDTREQLLVQLSRFDLATVQFDSGTTSLAPAAASTLDALAAWLVHNPAIRLRIEGHTDNTGADEVNLRISRQRAQAVANALSARNVPTDRLLARGYGASRPIASNDEADGRARNRRIELSIVF